MKIVWNLENKIMQRGQSNWEVCVGTLRGIVAKGGKLNVLKNQCCRLDPKAQVAGKGIEKRKDF